MVCGPPVELLILDCKFLFAVLAFVIFKVLTMNIEKLNGYNYNLKVPENEECDTTLGNNGMVYVKYDDYQFYPKFIVDYRL